MTNPEPKQRRKVIYVRHCGECPYSDMIRHTWNCMNINIEISNIDEYIKNKTLPDNCPLEWEEE